MQDKGIGFVTTISVAQVGVGYWGKNLARNFAELGVLAAIVDGNPQTAARIASGYGAPVRALDDVLADPAIDAVAFATPAETHAALAARALLAGKHVFVEKPLALETRIAAELCAIAKLSGKVLMVGHLMQYHPKFTALRELVQAGELGPLCYVYSNRMGLGKIRVEESALWSFAPHDISMLLALSGEEPVHVTAQGMSAITPGIADWATVQMAFASGLRGHIQVSWLNPFTEHRLVAIGGKAMAVFDDRAIEWNRKLSLHRVRYDRSNPAPVPDMAEAEYIATPHSEPLKNECRHFLDCIMSGARPRTCGNEALAVLRVLANAHDQIQPTLDKDFSCPKPAISSTKAAMSMTG